MIIWIFEENQTKTLDEKIKIHLIYKIKKNAIIFRSKSIKYEKYILSYFSYLIKKLPYLKGENASNDNIFHVSSFFFKPSKTP